MKGMLDKDGVAALLKEVDSDGDGRLSPSEWIAVRTHQTHFYLCTLYYFRTALLGNDQGKKTRGG